MQHANNYILTFNQTKLPEKIFVGTERKYVRKYKIRVIQCKKCWFFGHTAGVCKKTKTCEKCAAKGDEHDTEACSESLKCRSCRKAHKASDKNCPQWKKQIDIAKVRADHNVGYRSALEIFLKQNKKTPQEQFFYMDSESDSDYIPTSSDNSEMSEDSEVTARGSFIYKDRNVQASNKEAKTRKSYRLALKSKPKKSEKSKKHRSIFSSETKVQDGYYSLGLSESDSNSEQEEPSQVIQRRRPPNSSGRRRVMHRTMESLEEEKEKDGEAEGRSLYNENQKHVAIQTYHLVSKYTQTNNLNLKNSLKNFLRDIANTIVVVDGRPRFPCRQISTIMNKYFYLNVDAKWILHSLQK